MSFIIKSNASQATDVLIKDLGYLIPNSGGSVTLTDSEEIENARQSEDLRAYLIDDAHGAGSSTLILNDGTSDIAQADADNFMETYVLPDADEAFGTPKTDASGELTANQTFDGTATVSNLKAGTDVDLNSNKLTNVAAGTVSTDGVNKAQLDAVAASNKIWKELIIDCDAQLLDGASGGVRSAIPFWLQEQPTANDTFVIKDTGTTETYTFKASESAAFDVAIAGTGIDDTLANLVQAINDDSAAWGAVLVTTLESMNDGTGSVTAGYVVVIYELDANNAGDSRIYGSFATGVPEYVDYNGETDYEIETNSALPSSDPAERQFGIGRAYADLVTNETHACRTEDTVKSWNDDQEQWENTGANGIQAGSGLIKTGDVLDVDWGESGDIAALHATTAGAGSLEEAARADHVHPHGDLSGVATTHHSSEQIDEDSALANLGISAGDTQAQVNSAINSALAAGRFVGKVLQYSQTEVVKSSGTLYLKTAGGLLGSQAGKRMFRNFTISALSINVPDGYADASNAFKLSVEKSTDGGTTYAEIASLALPTSTESASTTSPSGSLTGNAGDLIRVAVVRTSGSTKSYFDAMDATVEYVDTAA